MNQTVDCINGVRSRHQHAHITAAALCLQLYLCAHLSGAQTAVLKVGTDAQAYSNEHQDHYVPFEVLETKEGTAYCSDNGSQFSLPKDCIIRTSDAIVHYSQCIASQPDSAWAHELRGLARMDQGDVDGALEDFSKAITKRPEWDKPIIHRGICYVVMGRVDDAASDFTTAIAMSESSEAYYARAVLHTYRLDHLSAANDLTHALAIRPGSIKLLWRRAQVHMMRKNYRDVVLDCNAILAISTSHDESLALRAHCKYLQGDATAAVIDYDGALSLKVTPDRLTEKATALLSLGRHTEAEAACTLCIARYGLQSKALLLRGISRYANNRFAEAKMDLEYCITQEPDLPQARMSLGAIYIYSKEFRDIRRGIAYLEEACVLTSWRDGDVILELASAKAEVGDFDSAVETARIALLLEDTSDEFRKQAAERVDAWSKRGQARRAE